MYFNISDSPIDDDADCKIDNAMLGYLVTALKSIESIAQIKLECLLAFYACVLLLTAQIIADNDFDDDGAILLFEALTLFHKLIFVGVLGKYAFTIPALMMCPKTHGSLLRWLADRQVNLCFRAGRTFNPDAASRLLIRA